jgi:predicted amidohydrolase YtcJ
VTTQRWILRGGSVIDGTGRPRYRADVALSGGRIEAVVPPGTIGETGDANLLDVSGHVVAPGFIDMHAHSDLAGGRCCQPLVWAWGSGSAGWSWGSAVGWGGGLEECRAPTLTYATSVVPGHLASFGLL